MSNVDLPYTIVGYCLWYKQAALVQLTSADLFVECVCTMHVHTCTHHDTPLGLTHKHACVSVCAFDADGRVMCQN